MSDEEKRKAFLEAMEYLVSESTKSTKRDIERLYRLRAEYEATGKFPSFVEWVVDYLGEERP